MPALSLGTQHKAAVNGSWKQKTAGGSRKHSASRRNFRFFLSNKTIRDNYEVKEGVEGFFQRLREVGVNVFSVSFQRDAYPEPQKAAEGSGGQQTRQRVLHERPRLALAT